MVASLTYLPPEVLRLKALALDALPDESRLSLDTARHYCHHLAVSHYENFTVVSWFLPSQLRQHFYNVYAYCRWADDLADETGNVEVSLDLLNWWEQELVACYQGVRRHPVFVALRDTIERFDIPVEPFRDLLTAFRQDQRVTRYDTYDDLLNYCRYSANPVGRLVLYLCGYRDAERQTLSDATCTGLQLANFWQDIAVDMKKGRIYLPGEDMTRFGCAEEALMAGVANEGFIRMMRFEVDRAREFLNTGMCLCRLVDRRVRADIELFNRGGLAILDAIAGQGYDTLTRRPALSGTKKIGLMLRYLWKSGLLLR